MTAGAALTPTEIGLIVSGSVLACAGIAAGVYYALSVRKKPTAPTSGGAIVDMQHSETIIK